MWVTKTSQNRLSMKLMVDLIRSSSLIELCQTPFKYIIRDVNHCYIWILFKTENFLLE